MGLFSEVFQALPLAAVVGGKVFAVHGGLFGRDGVTLGTWWGQWRRAVLAAELEARTFNDSGVCIPSLPPRLTSFPPLPARRRD
jgi:hypothetical protein